MIWVDNRKCIGEEGDGWTVEDISVSKAIFNETWRMILMSTDSAR